MLSKTLILACFAALATSYTLPEGAKDGVYVAYIDANGTEVHEPVDSIPKATLKMRIESRGLTKRGQTWCGCTFGVDHGDTDNANGALAGQFGNGATIGGHLAYYAISGSTVAFVCNKEDRAEVFTSDVVGRGAGAVTGACGRYISGTWAVEGYGHVDYGYMNSGPGQDFCGAAEASGRHSCPH